MRWSLLFLLFFSFHLYAESAPPADPSTATEAVEETVTLTPSEKIINTIDTLDDDLKVLAKQAAGKTGTAKNVIDMQMLKKNDEIRAEVQSLLNQYDEEQKPLVIKLVNEQVAYLKSAIDFLYKQLTAQQEEIDKADPEQKLLMQKSLQETTGLYHKMLKEQWINFRWLDRLGVPKPKEAAALVESVRQRLDFMSAMLSFDSQQEETLSGQLKAAAEGEKATLQLQQILAQRKVENDIEAVQYLADLGKEMGLETTDYTKQLFETTGNLTNELLNVKVIISILSGWFDNIKSWLLENTPQMLFKLFIFLLIVFIFKILKNITRQIVTRAVSSPTLRMSQLMKDFFISITGNVVLCIGLLFALAQVGLDLTPILTGFGVAGVIIGFALQDTLSNFASGMMLLIYRPFDVDDFVEAGGTSGKVSHMSLVSTTIKTFDNQILIVPNSKIWGDTIKNITHERVRRVDMVFGIGYSDDVEKAEKVLHDIVAEHPMVLRSPEAMIKLHVLNTSSVDFIVRPWVKTEDYWDVYWDVTREVKMRFDREGISIPFPQQDIHIISMPEKKA
ncbi:mechanosensitive ion channel domain-containing protein [Photobacterium aphoticum]|uniref:Small-conductance mechanosensitive channel n=1 Tax=Photobacterium aphoticum TaxID=754436 RepID=A0A0J1GTW8_9GAMM|nr:mechanosensitive ion channel domain-containing protein [Photobacterium aphoticum]KLV03111.1 mechanosensitive ion channel protein MscS [Photobacterium aphoticum]PSU56519.1 mechanosensitive ion channel protein MscS [Photobacterium aphoticum]GHA52043.1 mechanosensitive ion channel protein MscS [Photobacterium aphoticum]